MKEITEELAASIMNFVTDSHMEMLKKGVKTEDLRIAFPSYLEYFFMKGMTTLHGRMDGVGIASGEATICGIKVHPTWENALTLYFMDYPHSVSLDIPVFKLSFLSESEDYGLGKEVITYISKNYKYKL